MANPRTQKVDGYSLRSLLAYKYLFSAQLVVAMAVVIDYAFDNNINHILGNWFYLLVVAGEALSLIPFKAKNLERHRYLILGSSYLLVGVFLIFLTDIFGPYFPVLILVLLATVYWLGITGMLIGLTLELLTIVLGAWYQYHYLSSPVTSVISIHALELTVLGILFERVSLPHRLKAYSPERLLQTVSFERTRLLSLINSMADAVIATGGDGRILLYNGAMLDLLNTNVSLNDKYIQNWLQLYDDKDRAIDIVEMAKKSATALKRSDLYFLTPDHQKIRLYMDVAPIHSTEVDRRSGGGFIMILRDITKEKSLDEERTEFISVTSHELRTPIAIVEANISTALIPSFAKDLPQNVKQLLEQAHAQVLFLAQLVNDLTTLARAERGDLALEIVELNPTQILTKLAQDYKAEAAAKGLKLEVAPNLPADTINTSDLYVHEVLQNFITNALKYTQKGSIKLAASKSDRGIIFSVADSGIGISESDQKKIFSKFYRAEDYRTRETRGTGLGLYITKKLAQRINGRIWFTSRLNQGSIFYLEVPNFNRINRRSDQVVNTPSPDYVEPL